MRQPTKFLTMLLSGLFCFYANSAFAQANNPTSPQQIVSSVMQQYMAKHNIHGVAVAVYYQGQPYFYNFGEADAAQGQPVTSDTVFGIGSVSKVFTTTLLALEVQDGKMVLTDPVADYLPGNLKSSNTPATQITLVQLATHTASLPREIPQKNLPQIENFLQSWQPSVPIGTQYNYSNLSFGLLGFAVTNTAGANYETLLREDITTPLNMKDTGVGAPNRGSGPAAQGYDKTGTAIPYWNPVGSDRYSGGIYSTATDMMQFLEANMDINTGSAPTTLLQAMQMTHQLHFTVNPHYALGLGWSRITLPDGELLLSKDGGINGFSSYIGFIPHQNVGIVILSNISDVPPIRAGRAVLMRLANIQAPADADDNSMSSMQQQ